MNKPAPSELFKNALFTSSGLVAKCEVCGTIHFCLDDPMEGLDEIEVHDLSKTSKLDIANAIARFDPQSETGVNGSYDIDQLLYLLRGVKDKDKYFDIGSLSGVCSIVFRCEDVQALALGQRAEQLPAESIVAIPRIGHESIPFGRLDGKRVVAGCCDERIALYEGCFWESREVIANYFEMRADREMRVATDDVRIAKKSRKAAANQEE